jgi:multicomponent Na+:H+ antiporter subunit F
MSVLDILHLATACLAVAAGLLALWRVAAGPSLLDRSIANDVLTAAGISLVGVMIVGWGRQDLSVLLVILALTAFISAVVVSRFAVRERSDARRILTAEEAERQRVEREQAARDADRAEREQAARDAAREADLTAPGASLPNTEEEDE